MISLGCRGGVVKRRSLKSCVRRPVASNSKRKGFTATFFGRINTVL
jgi:hypothetical protein